MARSQFGPAAGASGGAAPRLADLKVPRYVRLDQAELHLLYHVLRDPLCAQLYTLLCIHSDFRSGELLTGYARLIELCTPPQPERGPRRAGPSMWQVRRALDDLQGVGLLTRGEQNEAQGQLRLYIAPRDTRTAAPAPKARREPRRVQNNLPQRENERRRA
jgi:hypothetical protein